MQKISLFKKKLCLEIYLQCVVFHPGAKFIRFSSTVTCNTCGQIDFNIEQGVQDRFLDDGRKQATKIVKSDSECFVECSLDCRCMSFSVCENSCQLNARSRTLVKNSLRHKPGCRYYDFRPFEVSSSSSKENLS